MSSNAQYVVKQISNVSRADLYTVCKILLFRGNELTQSNNGAYIHLKNIDIDTINDIYNFLKTKLSK